MAKKAILGFFLVLTALKLAAALRLDLFADEAFYWQCGQRPALAYTDLPLMTAFLVKLGVGLLGDTTVGVRFCFLIMGAFIPWVVFALAKPLIGGRDAWWAAATAMALPSIGYLGVMAIPDVPLMLFAGLYLLGMERGMRTGTLSGWLLCGLCGALGLATHYRFVLAPAAGALYLIFTQRGRSQLRGKGPWLALALMLPGLLPGLWYNFQHDMAPLSYFLAGRHGSTANWEQLFKHLVEQAFLLTPPMYLLLLWVLVKTLRRSRAGDEPARLLAFFSALPIGLYFLASPWNDSGPQSMHWPAPGYLPLMVCLPAFLRSLLSACPGWKGKALAIGIPGLAGLFLCAALWVMATGKPPISKLLHPFTGWSQAAERAERLLRLSPFARDSRPIVVADHYKLGANLEFLLGAKADIFILDHSKNYEHGRQRQFGLWSMGEDALRRHVGREALVIVEDSEIPKGHRERWMEHVRWLTFPLDPLDELRVSSGSREKRFLFFRGTIIPKR